MKERYAAYMAEGMSGSEAVGRLSRETGRTPAQVVDQLAAEGMDRRRFNRIRLPVSDQQPDAGQEPTAEETGPAAFPKGKADAPAVRDELLTVGWLLRSMGITDEERAENLTVRVRAKDRPGEICIHGESWILPLLAELPVETWTPSWKAPGELWIVVIPPGAGEAGDAGGL